MFFGEPQRNFCCGKIIMIRIGELMFQITEIFLILHSISDVVFKVQHKTSAMGNWTKQKLSTF